MKKIFVIIVTYNARHKNWIDHCLHSLEQSTYECVPVIVDNNSSDGTAEYVENTYPEAVVFRQQKNLGFGQANNVGIRYAVEQDADAVLLLNQDAMISPDTLALLASSDNEEALLTPIHMNGDGTRIDKMFKRSLMAMKEPIIDDYVTGNLKKKYEIGMFCAACWYIPMKIVRTVGGFNPLFFHYGEDDNLYNRIKLHGFSSYVISAARMYHDREEHGNIAVFNKNLLRREFLIAATNQNITKKERLNRYYRVWANHKKQVIPYLVTFLKLLCETGKIRRSNHQESQKGLTWL